MNNTLVYLLINGIIFCCQMESLQKIYLLFLEKNNFVGK